MPLARATLVMGLCCFGVAAGAGAILNNVVHTQNVQHIGPVLKKIRTIQSPVTRNDAIPWNPVPGRGMTGVAWSPDGQMLASYSHFGGLISLWDLDGNHVRDIERFYPSVDNSILFLAGGRELLTGATLRSQEDSAFAFTLWDVSTGREIRAIKGPVPVPVPPPVNRASIFTLSPDGQVVAAINHTPFGPVTIYSTADWSILSSRVVDARRKITPTSLAFSADSNLLAVGLISGKVALLDWRHPEAPPTLLDVYRQNYRSIDSVTFSPDHTLFATGAGPQYVPKPREQSGEDASLKLWNLADHSLTGSYSGPLAPIDQLSWSPDGRYLAVAAGDHTLRVF
jgi:WD40 repeat protein